MSISFKLKTNINILPNLTTSQINNKSFDDAPDIYYQSLSLGGQRVFRGMVKYAVQWERMFFSQSWLAGKCGLSLSQLKRHLKTFREDGVLSWIRRCNNTCLYTISTLFHSQHFHNKLKRFIPAIVFFFAPSMLQSKPAPRQLQIKNELHSDIRYNITQEGELNVERIKRISIKYSGFSSSSLSLEELNANKREKKRRYKENINKNFEDLNLEVLNHGEDTMEIEVLYHETLLAWATSFTPEELKWFRRDNALEEFLRYRRETEQRNNRRTMR